METLLPVDIKKAVKQCQTEGIVLLSYVINPPFLKKLVAEVESGPYELAKDSPALVKQQFSRYAFLRRPVVGMPYLRRLQLAIQALLRSAHSVCPALASWRALDIVVQKYAKDGGLGGHRDLSRHPLIIASFTLTGRCRFELLADRQGPVLETLQPYPGDLVLLRAQGLREPHDSALENDPCVVGDFLADDDRPFHRVSGAITATPRVSVTFRDNLQPDKPITGFSYTNV